MESVVSGTSTLLQPGSTTSTYDVNNNLVAVSDATKAANNRSLVNDVAGRILQSTQNGNTQRQLVANGEVLGRYGTYLNADKPADSSGNPLFTTGASFNFGYTKISGSYPGANPGTRTVAAGETLQSIAKSIYGDSSLWYLVADANGLGSDRDLRVGQTLTLPSRVTGAANNSSTFKPYNPGEVVGNTTPNLPSPPAGGGGGGGCGGLGMIIMIVVAVAVTVATGGAAAAALGPVWGGAAAAAMGSIASQLVSNALGIVDGFDWKGVALAAISGGVGGGMSSVANGSSALSGQGVVVTMARAAIGNAMTQGIAVVTGLQDKFSWTSVAASAVGAGVGAALDDSIMGTRIEGPTMPGQTLGRTGGLVGEMGGGSGAQLFGASLKGFAAGVSSAVARGGRVAVTQIATDAFGNALGESWGESLRAQSAQEQKLAAIAKENAKRAETQAATFDALTKAFSDTRSMPSYGPGVLMASADGYQPDGVVSDAGGGGNEQEELVAGTGFKLRPGGGGLKLDANSVGDVGSGQGTFDLDDMQAQFGPDAITGPDPAPEQPSSRDSKVGRSISSGFSDGRDARDMRLGFASQAEDLGKSSIALKNAGEEFAKKAAQAYAAGDRAEGDKYLNYSSGYYKASGDAKMAASNLDAAAPKFQLPAAEVGAPGKDLAFELKLGGALYAGAGGNFEVSAKINSSRPFESSLTEGEWGLGFGFGAKGKAGWGPISGREGSQTLPVGSLYKLGDGQADGTGAISLKAAFEVSVPTANFVVGELRAGVQSPLNGVPAANKNFGGFYETKIGEYKVAPTTQLGATFKVDLFNNSYKRAKP